MTPGQTLVLSLPLPCGPPGGGGRSATRGCGSQWAGGGVGSLVILYPSNTWPHLEAFYWEWGCYWGLGGQGHRRRSPSFRTQDRAHNKGHSGPRCEDPPPKEAPPGLTGSWIWGPGGLALTVVPLGLGALAVFSKGLLWAWGPSFGKH